MIRSFAAQNQSARDNAAVRPQLPQVPSMAEKEKGRMDSLATPPMGQRPVQRMKPDNGQWGGAPRYLSAQSGAYNAAAAKPMQVSQQAKPPSAYPGGNTNRPSFSAQMQMANQSYANALNSMGGQGVDYSAYVNNLQQQAQPQMPRAMMHFRGLPSLPQPMPQRPMPMSNSANNLSNQAQQYALDRMRYQQNINNYLSSQQMNPAQNAFGANIQNYFQQLRPVFSNNAYAYQQPAPPPQYITPIQPGAI